MKLGKKMFVILFVITVLHGSAQISNNSSLEKQISDYNDALHYEKSIAVLTKITSNDAASFYDKYYAYLLKSHTYKRLFNYPKTLEALHDAYEVGIKSDKKEEVANTILAEKSFVYFDTQKYSAAAALMQKLANVNYKYIREQDKCWIITQEGYLFFLDKKYVEAEKKYNLAIAILSQSAPHQLPNIFGKKIELYNEMTLFTKRDESFKKGLAIAKKYNKIKYEMYLHQMLKNAFAKNNDYKNAFITQQKFDSVSKIYNNNENSGKVEILEQKIQKEKQALVLKNENYFRFILYGCILFLFIVIFLVCKLYLSNKSRRELAELENERINEDIERLTKELDEKGNVKIDLSQFQLSSRQLKIINEIQKGLTNKEIATELFISENTVKYHLKVIYDILKIEKRSSFLKYID